MGKEIVCLSIWTERNEMGSKGFWSTFTQVRGLPCSSINENLLGLYMERDVIIWKN